jgi:hypothetical protein
VRLGSSAAVGGAFARQGANACSWAVGSPGISKTFSFAGGSFTMSSFRNTLVHPAREYVTPGTPSPGFSFGWDGTQLSGASGGWSCVSGAAWRVLAGGAPALQLDVVLSRPAVRVTEHYLVYPDVAVIAEWAGYTGTDDQAHQLSQPSFLDQQIMGGAVAGTDLVQMAAANQEFEVQAQPLDQVPAPGFTSVVPWLALWDRASLDGVYAGDVASAGSATDSPAGIGVAVAGGSVGLTMVAPDVPLAAGQTFSGPHAFVGVYHKELDDMTNRLLDWQYGYLWDYTRPGYFPAVRDEGFWGVGSFWFGDSDPAGTLQKVFDFAGDMRAIGADVYARDAGWDPQDWRLTHDYLVKSGMQQSIYLANDVADWGPLEWRIDNTGLPPDNSVQTFLDACQQCAYNGVNATGQLGFNLVRFADAITYSLGGNVAQDGASRLFPIDKMTGIPEFTGQMFRCTPAWANDQLMQSVYLYGDTSNPALAECTRKMIDMYHYLAAQGVAGRWSQQYHPHASDSLDTNWFERLSADGQHGVILYKGLVPCYLSLTPNGNECNGPAPSGTPPAPSASPVTVYPKGLNPKASYDVRYEIQPGQVQRSGADLMAHGVTFTSVKPGERIYLGLPDHPGAGTDQVAPQPPSQVTAAVGTNMGFSGVELTWAPGSDNNWVSYYQVLRGGKVIGQVAKGTYYFDHTLGVPGAQYAVRTVDGDGNVSAAGPASQAGLPSIATADDASPQVKYTGIWTRQAGQSEAANQTQSLATVPSCHLACRGFSGTQGAGGWSYEYTPLACHLACQQFSDTQGQQGWHFQDDPVPCHTACQGFSSVQGANGWSYQTRPSGSQWTDIQGYTSRFGLNGDCCLWLDSSASAFSGTIGPRSILAGLNADTARAWTAPAAGTVDISAHAIPASAFASVLTITVNDQPVWGPVTLDGSGAPVETSVAGLSVAPGDVVRFQLQGTPSLDINSVVQWDPGVLYRGGPPPPPPPPWADIIRYYPGEDIAGDGPFWRDGQGTVSARDLAPTPVMAVARSWVAPKDGVVDIVATAAPQGGPATLLITRDDQPLWGPQRITASTGTSLSGITVTAGDVIRFADAAGGAVVPFGPSPTVQWDPDIFYQDQPQPPVTGDPSPITTYNPDISPEATPPPPFGNDGGFWHDPSTQSSGAEAAGYITATLLQPGQYRGVLRVWTAPKSGLIDITAAAFATSTVQISITRNGQPVWGPQAIDGSANPVETDVTQLRVAAGDRVAFRADAGGGRVAWDPEIHYAGDPPPPAQVPPSASWSFTGSQVTWFAKLGRDMGQAQVSIDGHPDAVIDLYAPDANNWSIPVYARTFAAAGHHTITVTAVAGGDDLTHRHISIDGFQAVTGKPAVTQDTGRQVTYTGSGWQSQADPAASGGHLMASPAAGDTVSFTFTGASVTWAGRICPACGEADVYVDGTYVTRVDTYGYRGPLVPQAAVFEQGWTQPGTHTIEIIVRGTSNPRAQGTEVDIDSFHVR